MRSDRCLHTPHLSPLRQSTYPMKIFLLFDIDGTLLFSNKIDSQCFAESYEAIFGEEFPSIDWRQYPHVTDHVIFRTVFQQHFYRLPTANERSHFEQHYVERLQHERRVQPEAFQEVPGAAACWQALSQDDRFVLGIATGGWRTPAQVKLSHVGIHPIPDYAAYANNMEQRDHILQSAIEQAQADYDIESVVYLGDALWDVVTTRQMNIPFIGVRREGDNEVLHREGVDIILNHYKDIGAVYSAVEQVLAVSK